MEYAEENFHTSKNKKILHFFPSKKEEKITA